MMQARASWRRFTQRLDRLATTLWGRALMAVGFFLLTMISYQLLNRTLAPRVDLMTPWDAMIPFVPWTIAIYGSFWGILLSAALVVRPQEYTRLLLALLATNYLCYVGFIALPAHYPRPDVSQLEGLWGAWLRQTYEGDPPGNTFPSIHVAATMVLSMRMRLQRGGALWLIWGGLICASTLTVKQHFIADVIGGLALAAAVYVAAYRGWSPDEPPPADPDDAPMTTPLSPRAKRALHVAYLSGLAGAWRRLRQALPSPERAQRARLAAILPALAQQPYGRSLGLDKASSAEDLQRVCPVQRYEALEPWIDRLARGQRQTLSAHGVTLLERSGGSSGVDKLLPFNAAFLAELGQATDAWLFDMYAARPALLGTTAYWSLSPVTKARQMTQGGVPIGVEDDTEYFSPMIAWALKQLMAVPGQVARQTDFERWRHATLVHLLEARDLGLISIWNPTFLTLLLEHARDHIEELLDAVEAPRARALRAQLDARGAFEVEAIWPKLGLISTWADASARHFIPGLRELVPHVELQPKGLLATEGVITIPWSAARGNVLALNSHFYEFVDLEHPEAPPRFGWQLELGRAYSPLLTTSAGLARYDLRDTVRCVGFCHATPLLRFEGKLDRTSDLCGEKLTLGQVDRALTQAAQDLGARYRFALVAPSRQGGPHYRLYVELEQGPQRAAALARRVDDLLSQSHHYGHCRQLGQLGPLQGHAVRRGDQTYLQVLRQQGQRAGDIKPAPLDHRLIWDDQFQPALP